MVWVPRPHTFSFQRFEAWARGPWPSLCEGLSRRTFSRVRTDLMPIAQRRLLPVVALVWFRSEMRIVTLSIMSFAVLVTQVGVGALTITSGNDWVVVTIHLALGTATLASALIVALVSLWPPKT